MKRPSPALCIAFVLSFSGCTCEYHYGSRRSYGSSGGEQVIVVEQPQQPSPGVRTTRDRNRPPRRAGDAGKSIHAGPAPHSPGTVVVPVGSGPTQGRGPSEGMGAAPAGGVNPSTGAPVAQPTPVAPAPAPAAPQPAPPVAQPQPAAPAPTPVGDTYVRARDPNNRAPGAGGAGVAADPAKGTPAPSRGTYGKKQ